MDIFEFQSNWLPKTTENGQTVSINNVIFFVFRQKF